MLSPGQWHKGVPREPRENLSFRSWLMDRARKEPKLRRELIVACSQDLLFYVNAFCYLYEPRGKLGVIPFCTYPYQDRGFLELLDAIDCQVDLVIEKSRDMGASWMSVTAMEWLWHFHDGCQFLMMSRKEDLVDKPDNPDALFWKIDHLHKHLPAWLRPKMERRKMGFMNTENANAMTGEATTDASGVGGRATAAFIDEFSRFKDGDKVMSGTADVTNCRIFNFTPWGQGAAKKLAARKDVRKLRLHWSEHPDKAQGLYQYCKDRRKRFYLDPTGYIHDPNYPFIDDGMLRSPWYDEECRRRANKQEIAQNLDIDWGGSSYQFFDAEIIGELQRAHCCKPYVAGDLQYDPDNGRPLEFLTRDAGPVRLWMNLDGQGRPPVRKYSVGCDISLGTGATNSCCSAFDLSTGEKVLEFATAHMRADAFAAKVVALCHWLRSPEGESAYLGWEMQGPGIMFGKKVIELGYRHVYYRTNEQSLGKQISDTPGWTPTPDNKRVLLEEYRTALASKACMNRSYEALEECLAMIHLPNGMIEHTGALETEDPTGARANHGDRVIADAIGWKLCRERQAARGKVKEEMKPGSLAWRRDGREQERKRELAWV